MRTRSLFILWLFGLLAATLPVASVYAQSVPVVHAVLFYSPTCAHCHEVMTVVLPPLEAQYGDRLAILEVDATQSQGQTLYRAALQQFSVPAERRGVPLLIIGDTVLVGADEIPQQFPALVERHLAAGGVDWPAVPGLAEYVGAPPAASQSPFALLLRDPPSATLLLATLAGMVVVVVQSVAVWRARQAPAAPPEWQAWAVPALSVLGLGVAAYLAYVETQSVAAFCGPVGDCNAVQQSPYARLFGVLPIGLLGVAGYVAVLAAWALTRVARGPLADLAAVALLGMTLFGTLFSIYLTMLETFVIFALCIWCLISAVVMTALLWLARAPGRRAWIRLHQGDPDAVKRRRARRPVARTGP